MDITLVKVFPVHEEKLKAFVSVVFDSCFMVNDIKIIQGKDGLFLSMPSRRKKTGEFKDVAHPLNNSFRRLLEERVLGEYRQMVDDVTPRRPDREGDEEDSEGEGAPAVNAAPSPGPGENGTAADDAPSSAPPKHPAENAASGNEGAGNPAEDGPKDGHEPSLEEVQQKHLQDSFWSVRGRS